MLIFEKYPDLYNEKFVENYDFSKAYTRVDLDAPFSELDVAVAIMTTKGNLTKAAKLIGRPRTSLKNFIARNDLLTELEIDLEEQFIDEVEEKHKNEALNGDISTQRFFLTTKGGKRGCTPKQQIDVSAPNITFNGADADL